MIWRKDPEKHAPEQDHGPNAADTLAEDERDCFSHQDDQDEIIVREIIEDIVDQVYYLGEFLDEYM